MRKLVVIAAIAVSTACTHDIQNKEAVHAGIVDYLKAREEKTGLSVDRMNVDISGLTFTSGGNEAHANVKFTPKKEGGDGMTMPYTLDRKGDKWVVRAHAEGGENPHAATGLPPLPVLPPSHPPVDKKQ